MSDKGELGRQGQRPAIPVEELEKMLGSGSAFSSGDVANPMVSASMDRWPFLFSRPLSKAPTPKKPTR